MKDCRRRRGAITTIARVVAALNNLRLEVAEAWQCRANGPEVQGPHRITGRRSAQVPCVRLREWRWTFGSRSAGVPPGHTARSVKTALS